MNSGKQNEYDFVLMFNGKKISELDPNSYDLIHAIYNNINDGNVVKAWKNHYKQKTDIMIKRNNKGNKHKKREQKFGTCRTP